MLERLEAQMRFYPGVHINVFRTHDQHRVETVSYSGKMYHKTLISLTNQIGCPVACDFCKVSEQRYKRNITIDEYVAQVDSILENEEKIPWFDAEKKVKVGFTRAGESLLNTYTLGGIKAIAQKYQPSFQLTSVMPNTLVTQTILEGIQEYVQEYEPPFQFNISMHTSNEKKRQEMMSGFKRLMTFDEISRWGERWVQEGSKRKVNLSFVLMQDNEVDLGKLRNIFPPDYFSLRFACYLPSSRETAHRHTPSARELIYHKTSDAEELGYQCISSMAQEIEWQWDTRPYSTFKMLYGQY